MCMCMRMLGVTKYNSRLTCSSIFYFERVCITHQAMTTTQLRIAQTLGLFYDDWVVMSQGGREYVKTIERFNEETKTDLVISFIPLYASP